MDELIQIKATARRGAARVKSLMPEWEIEPEVAVGSPGSAILEKSEVWNPDLIVSSHMVEGRPGESFSEAPL